MKQLRLIACLCLAAAPQFAIFAEHLRGPLRHLLEAPGILRAPHGLRGLQTTALAFLKRSLRRRQRQRLRLWEDDEAWHLDNLLAAGGAAQPKGAGFSEAAGVL